MFTETLLQQISQDLYQQGFSLQQQAAPNALCTALLNRLQTRQAQQPFQAAKIGRQQTLQSNEQVRNDRILWLDGAHAAEQQYCAWLTQLQQHLNRQFYLGLTHFESHYAVYQPGDFYKKHVDAFKGQSNRKVSLVLYLNENWRQSDGGELLLHTEQPLRFLPQFASFALFMSDEIAHEVLPSHKTRYSIASWFRVD